MTDLSTLSDQQLLALPARTSAPARPVPQQAWPAPDAPQPAQSATPQAAVMTAAAAPANAIDPAIVHAELQRSANPGRLAADTIRQHMAAILANPALRQRYAADELAQMERMRNDTVGAGTPAPVPAAPRASFWDLLPLAGAGLLPPRQPPVPGRRQTNR